MSKLYESEISSECKHSFKMILKKLTKLDKTMTFENKLQVVIFSLSTLNIDGENSNLNFLDSEVINGMLDEIISSVHV